MVTDFAIVHDPDEQAFRLEVDGHSCELRYRLHGTVMTIRHTGVPDAVSGRGIAAALVQAAFALARDQGWTVIPVCSYTAAYVKRHPELDHLIHRGASAS